MNQINLILGTAGHIDHGKTTLIRALTGVETDRLPEEQKRGITIELGFAHLQHGVLTLDLVVQHTMGMGGTTLGMATSRAAASGYHR